MTRNPFPPGRRDEVLSRDRWTCQASTRDPDIELSAGPCDGPLVVHHVKPKGAGGSSDPAIHDASNLLTLCSRHHQFVHAFPLRSYESGLLQRRAA